MATPNRILEFTPSQEEAVVSRVLVLVHQVIDENFPGVEKAGRQFTKTVFSAEGESTALSPTPANTFGSDEATSPGGRPSADPNASSITPPLPGASPARPTDQASAPEREPTPPSQSARPAPTGANAGGAAVSTRSSAGSLLPTGTLDEEVAIGRGSADWAMRIMLALFIAGLIVLAYALLS